MGLTLITPPTIGPVSVNEAMIFLRSFNVDEYEFISSLIRAATEYCEDYLGRALISSTWLQTFDIFPIYSGLQFPFPFFQQLPESAVYQTGNYGYLQTPNYGVMSPADFTKLTLPNWGMLALPKPPLIGVTSIQYLDPNNVLQTWDASNYQVVTSNTPGFVKPSPTQTTPGFPSIAPNTSEAVRVTFTAGYGTTAAKVPAPIRIAIKMLLAQWYEVRQPAPVGKAIEETVHRLLNKYRFYGFF